MLAGVEILKGCVERPSGRLITGRTIFRTSRVFGATFENRRYLSAELKYPGALPTVGGAYFPHTTAHYQNTIVEYQNSTQPMFVRNVVTGAF